MKNKVDFYTGILLFLLSIVILLMPIFSVSNVNLLLKIILLFYTIVNLGRYILNYKTKDYEGLFTALVSLILFIILLCYKVENSSLQLSLVLFAFVACYAFIRLKKADYYNDRKNKMWILEITTLIVFIISGLLTSFSILLTNETNIFMIGFLFFINGFIEIIDPIVNFIKEK